MSGGVLFEQTHRGNLWRLEVVTWKGRTFANWRKFYDAKGEWKPTREGFTMPLDSLADLTATLMVHQGLKPPERQAAGG